MKFEAAEGRDCALCGRVYNILSFAISLQRPCTHALSLSVQQGSRMPGPWAVHLPAVKKSRLTRKSLAHSSEENEDLLDVAFDVLDLLADDVEADGLGDGTALANGHDVTGLDAEGGRAVSGDGLVALLEPVVLLDVMQVIASDDDGPGHFCGNDNAPNQSETSAIV